jgi:hypothetical protein
MNPMGGKFNGEPDNGWMIARDRRHSNAFAGSVFPTREAAIAAVAEEIWDLMPFEHYVVGRVEGDVVLEQERLIATVEQITK